MLAKRLAARAALAVVLSLGLTVATVSTAGADSTAYDDPVGDSTYVDISKVRVTHSNAVKVKVKSALPLDYNQLYGFWIDVGRGGPEPDYYVAFGPNQGYDDSITKVRSFQDRRGRTVPCRGLGASADVFEPTKPVIVRIPRRCLGNPGRVRVAVEFDDTERGTEDWSADRRTFGPWVRR